MRWMMCLGVVALLVGCDGSKQELDSTKASLTEVTKERDALKGQVAVLQQQLDASKAELAKTKTPATPATSATATAAKTDAAAAKTAAPEKGKHHHS